MVSSHSSSPSHLCVEMMGWPIFEWTEYRQETSGVGNQGRHNLSHLINREGGEFDSQKDNKHPISIEFQKARIFYHPTLISERRNKSHRNLPNFS
jgi:hypothetical protein